MPDLVLIVAVGGALQLALIVFSLLTTWALTAVLRRRGVRRIQPLAAGPAVLVHELTYLSINMVASLLIIGITASLWADGVVDIRFDQPTLLSIAGEIVLYLVGLDIYTYAIHRLMHTRWLFRHIHAVHHRSRAPSALTAYSFHPAEWLVLGLYFPLSLTMVDYHLVTLAIVTVLQSFMNTMPHCGYEYAPRGWYEHRISRLFLTAFFHELHHERVTCNYGTVTTL